MAPKNKRENDTRGLSSKHKRIDTIYQYFKQQSPNQDEKSDDDFVASPKKTKSHNSINKKLTLKRKVENDDDFIPMSSPKKKSYKSSQKKSSQSVKKQKVQPSVNVDILVGDEDPTELKDGDEDPTDGDEDTMKDGNIPVVDQDTTKVKDGVVSCSLLSLFNSSHPDIEKQRRAYVVSHAIRFAAQEMAKINKLANMLMTLYLLDLIKHNKVIPLRLCDQNTTMWNWCMLLTSTVDGKHKKHPYDKPIPLGPPPATLKSKSKKATKNKVIDPTNSLQMKMARKNQLKMQKQQEEKKKEKKPRKKKTDEQKEIEKIRQNQQSEKIKSIQVEESKKLVQHQTYLDIKRVFEKQMKPTMPTNFKWPDRFGLSEMQSFECLKRSTTFKNLYSTTFIDRQEKVVRKQVDEWLCSQVFDWNAKIRREIRFTITSHIIPHINRWSFEEDNKLESLSHNHMNHQQQQDLLDFINNLIEEHQEAFGNSPLQEEYYRLSEDDAGKCASFYVHYFYYLNQQYKQFSSLKQERLQQLSDQKSIDEVEILGKLSIYTKWKSFPNVPQVNLHVPFVELNAKALFQLIRFTSTNACNQFILGGLDEYVRRDDSLAAIAVQVRENPTLDWINATDREWAQDNPIPMFDQLFSGCFGYKKVLCTKTSKSKYKAINFESIISTNGIQANVHYKTEQLIQDQPKKKKRSTKKDETQLSCDTITSDMFDQWIAEHKTLISVDPGHKDLISAVRHHHGPSFSPPPLINATTRKGKQKQARRLRQQENNQSIYTLSNKCYYEMAGFTSANATRRRWRTQSPLNDLDQYLSSEFETCNQRTWKSDVYLMYIKFITEQWTKIWNELCQVKYRKLRFRVYQKNQQAYAKIAKDLTNGSPSVCVVIWGNGSFGPTSRGHASAPNKKLRMKLAHHGVKILLGDEYMTSQNTACCSIKSQYSYQTQQSRKLIGPQVEFLPPLTKRKLRGLLYCKHVSSTHPTTNPLLQHATLHRHHDQTQASDMLPSLPSLRPVIKRTSRPWNRDVCANLNIIRIAYGKAYETKGPSSITLPSCFKRPNKKKTQKPTPATV